MKWNEWKKQINSRPWILAPIALGLSLLLTYFTQSNSKEAPPTAAIDTFIPAGFVLVPISVQNFASLDSVIGNFGFVDLYAVKENGQRQATPLGRNIKLLRAPKNPNQFAVLVPEAAAPEIVKHSESFYVVIQNTKTRGTIFEKPVVPRVKGQSRAIIYEGDGL